MATEIVLPALSPTMSAGTLTCWHKAVGDSVQTGDIIAEVETDKAAVDIEAQADGVLAEIRVAGGTADVPVNTVIGVLRAQGEPLEPAPPVQAQPALADDAADGRIRISPLARRLAHEKGLDIATLRGSGPRGRILMQDVLDAGARPAPVPKPPEAPALAAPPPVPALAPAPVPTETAARSSAPPVVPSGARAVPHDAMRLAIARRLTQAKRDVPHFYAKARCNVDALLALRETLNAALAGEPSPVRLTINDFLLKALAAALQRVPEANVTFSDEAMLHHVHVDVGVAVALENGLITPIIRAADTKSVTGIALELRDMIGRAKERRLRPDEYEGGTAGISNLGMYGVSEFAAIVNPPQSLNLAVGAVEPRVVLRDGVPGEVRELSLTLSVDHRAIDGATAARLLAALRTVIETPVLLLA